MQTIYVHLFMILFICLFLYRMCWNFYIWGGGGGCLLKKLIFAYLLRNKKKYKEEKNATVKFYVM